MLPPLSRRLQEVTLEGTWAETSQGKPFMLANDGNGQKIVVFSTDENLEKLSASEQIFMDGTFKVAPPFHADVHSARTVSGPNDSSFLCIAALQNTRDSCSSL